MAAADRFAQAHDAARADGRPALAGRYSALMPATPPAAGQQYAFDVDLDACSGCKSCVAACHALNGLEEEKSWRDVGLLHGGSQSLPVIQHVTTACHHCLDPACMHACPVEAYEKDPVTGIVRHLDDQCFGCQYCTLACPLRGAQVQPRQGHRPQVRHVQRPARRGRGPRLRAVVSQRGHRHSRGRRRAGRRGVGNPLVRPRRAGAGPDAADHGVSGPRASCRATWCRPTTTPCGPSRPTGRLILMLTLTQLSVGAFLVERLLELIVPGALTASIRPVHSASALVFGLLALAVSVLHLGRPRYAYRAVLGLRHSWLSREILAFGVFAGLAVAYAGWSWAASAGWLEPPGGWAAERRRGAGRGGPDPGGGWDGASRCRARPASSAPSWCTSTRSAISGTVRPPRAASS